jgi:hypothetical protein
MADTERTPAFDGDAFYVPDMEQKYVVIKQADWQQFLMHVHAMSQFALLEHAAELEINGDFFVVREQDVFASAGLHAYANNITTSVEVAEMGISLLDTETKQRMLDLADTLSHMAAAWKNRADLKIPD